MTTCVNNKNFLYVLPLLHNIYHDLIQKGLSIIEVSDDTQFLDGNISRLTEETDKYVLRANAKGRPEYIDKSIDGVTYKAVKVGDRYYIPVK